MDLERFSRIKHDYGYSEEFVSFCLKSVGLGIEDVDYVSMNSWIENPYALRPNTVLRPCPVPATSTDLVIPFKATILGRDIPAYAINHHLAHAACAFFTSPFEESAILGVDGGGDDENFSYAKGVGNKIKDFTRESKVNLCGWWSGITLNNYRMKRIHEWDPGSGAGKIMALAAYGQHDAAIAERLIADIRSPVYKDTYTDKYSVAFNEDEDLSDTKNPRAQSLAYHLQTITEEFLQAVFGQMASWSGSKNICYAGGLALNCVANTRVMKDGPFTGLHVPPCPIPPI